MYKGQDDQYVVVHSQASDLNQNDKVDSLLVVVHSMLLDMKMKLKDVDA